MPADLPPNIEALEARKPQAQSAFSRATRWCDEHKHDDDVRDVAAVEREEG